MELSSYRVKGKTSMLATMAALDLAKAWVWAWGSVEEE
jgi:hypothetical protein